MTIVAGNCCSGGGGGGGSVDHFAPRYIVGNSLAPYLDPVAPQAAPFQYIPDPGDGSGIRAACLAAVAVPGDIWVRPGNYTIPAGAGPITIPGVTLRGAGRGSTNVIGPSTGDQGVFILATGLATGRLASLESLTVNVPAPTGATAGSVAAVVTQDTVLVRDVFVVFASNALSTLTTGVQMTLLTSPFPASDLLNVIVVYGGDGLNPVPTIGIEIIGGQNGSLAVAARNVQVFSSGEGLIGTSIRCQDATLIASQLVAVRHSLFGIEFVGSGRLSVDEGLIQAGTGGLVIGVSLAGSGHVLRSVGIESILGSVGIRLADGTSSNDMEIEDCQINGFEEGVVCQNDAVGNTITNSTISASGRGIAFSGVNVTRNRILDNDVTVQPPGASLPVLGGILISQPSDGASENFVNGNRVLVRTEFGSTFTHCIENYSQLGSCSKNICTIIGGGWCIELGQDSERVVCEGNVCQASGQVLPPLPDSLGCIHVAPGDLQAPDRVVRSIVNGNSCTANYTIDQDPLTGLPAAIVCEGERCVVNNNAVFMGTPGAASPGITLTAVSAQCNSIGNVCEGSGGVAVTDLGAGNNVAQNIGA